VGMSTKIMSKPLLLFSPDLHGIQILKS